MARNALPSSAAGISSFKRITTTSVPAPVSSQPGRGQTAICPDCKTVFALFSEGARGWNTKPHRVCLACYRARRGRRPSERPRNRSMQPPQPEVATTLTQVSAFTSAPCQHRRRQRATRAIICEIVAPHLV